MIFGKKYCAVLFLVFTLAALTLYCVAFIVTPIGDSILFNNKLAIVLENNSPYQLTNVQISTDEDHNEIKLLVPQSKKIVKLYLPREGGLRIRYSANGKMKQKNDIGYIEGGYHVKIVITASENVQFQTCNLFSVYFC